MKAARFGIRTFRPTLRKAEEKLKGLRTAEGTPLPDPSSADSGPAIGCASHAARSSDWKAWSPAPGRVKESRSCLAS
jgi:hypothetical protein